MLVVTIASLFACAGSQQTPSILSVPTDLTISLGQGGGFSGMWDGYSVDADGTVEHWSGVVRGDNSRRAATLSESQVQELWQRLNQDDLLVHGLSEIGNFTAYIEVTADGNTHRLSWAVGSETEDEFARAAASAYRDLRRMLDAFATDDPR